MKATPNPTNFADMFPFYEENPGDSGAGPTHGNTSHMNVGEVTLTLVLMDTYVTLTIWIGH